MSNTYAKPELWNSHALVTDDGKASASKFNPKEFEKKFKLPMSAKSDAKLVPHNEEVLDEISSKVAKSYLKKTAPGSEDAKKIDSAIDSQLSGGKEKDTTETRKLVQKGFNRLTGRIDAENRTGIRGAIRRLAMKEEAELNERDRSEYAANQQLSGNTRGKPGHYLVKNGIKISGPHDSMDNAYSEYRKLDDVRGVKILHMREDTVDPKQATEKKVKAAAEKAVTLAKKKIKGNQTANTKPELPMPNTQTSQPALMGSEQESESKGA